MGATHHRLGLLDGQLRLAPPSPTWAADFSAEAARISAAMRGIALTIDHIGSTAVPGLPAKPILDLALCAAAPDERAVAEKLCAMGYADRGLRSGRLFVRCTGGRARTHNLHLYRQGDKQHAAQLAFRDALRADAGLREAYAALKRELVTELGNGGRTRYADAKAAFIAAALARSGTAARTPNSP